MLSNGVPFPGKDDRAIARNLECEIAWVIRNESPSRSPRRCRRRSPTRDVRRDRDPGRPSPPSSKASLAVRLDSLVSCSFLMTRRRSCIMSDAGVTGARGGRSLEGRGGYARLDVRSSACAGFRGGDVVGLVVGDQEHEHERDERSTSERRK
jgi:hypothetical protein